MFRSGDNPNCNNEGAAPKKVKGKIRVLCGIPSLNDQDRYGSYIPTVKAAIHTSIAYFPDFEFTVLATPNTCETGIMGIVDRQNYLINLALRDDYDYLWIVQSDVEVPRHAFGHLYWLDVDLAYGIVERHSEDDFIAGFIDHKKKTWYLPRFLVRKSILRGAAFAGCNCMLIKRCILEKTRFKYEPGGTFGEDVNFAYDVARLGFSSAIEGHVECGHLPEKPVSERNTLDVGCGHLPEGTINVDLHPEATAHRSGDQNRVEDWDLDTKQISHFVKADGQVLPFADGSFDHVLSNQCIEHVFDAEKFLSEILRVTKYTAEISSPDPDGPHAHSETKPLHIHTITPLWYELQLRKRAIVVCNVDKSRSWLTAKILKVRT